MPTSWSVLSTFKHICPVGIQIQTLVNFAHFQVQARKRGVLGWGCWCFVYINIPERCFWLLSKEQGLVVVFWAKCDPIWAKWDPSGLCMKNHYLQINHKFVVPLPEQSRKTWMHRLDKLIKNLNACKCLLSVFTSFGTGNSRFKWIYFFKTTPDSCFVLLSTHQWCPVLSDMFFFSMLCVAKQY